MRLDGASYAVRRGVLCGYTGRPMWLDGESGRVIRAFNDMVNRYQSLVREDEYCYDTQTRMNLYACARTPGTEYFCSLSDEYNETMSNDSFGTGDTGAELMIPNNINNNRARSPGAESYEGGIFPPELLTRRRERIQDIVALGECPEPQPERGRGG